MNDKDEPEMVEMTMPDCDTVEFEIEHLPAPLQWDGGYRTLQWARDPGVPIEDAARWDAVLSELRKWINAASEVHLPAEDAVVKGLKPGPWEPPGDRMLLEVKALRELLPPAIQVAPIIVRKLRVVKAHTQMMRKGAFW